MRWINTSHLQQYGLSHDSKGSFPLIVSRLIRATVTKLNKAEFPNDRNVYVGGWDGILITDEKTEFCPEGVSLWEFGTNQNVKGKADGDYEKRTKDPLGYTMADCTFVFVTPFAWHSKDKWVEERKKEGKWKDVVVIDGQDLENWFMMAPAVAKGFAERLGILPTEQLLSGEEYWEEWTTGPKISLSADLICSGRDEALKKIQDFLVGPANLTTIRAASRDEAVAFILASVMKMEEQEKESILSRLLIVLDENTFRKVLPFSEQLILIPLFGGTALAHKAVGKGHLVIIPTGPNPSDKGRIEIELPKIDREGFVIQLQELGVEEEIAKKISKETSRNLTILRRYLDFEIGKTPDWAKPEIAHSLVSALLAGRWDESFEGDIEVLTKLGGKPYSEQSKVITSFLNRPDSPFQKIGQKWRLLSPLDSWQYLAAYVTDNDLKIFAEVFQEVLGTYHPRFDLAPDERLHAQFRGKILKFSPWLREGLCQTLMVLAVYGDSFDTTSSVTNFQVWVDGMIHTLLKDASGKLWCTLASVLPEIAEASPSSFLNAIEASCDSEEKIILSLFEQEDGLTISHSHHSGLLWGLENIAWLPEHLARATIVLGKLDQLDPGGNLSNRPINSLRQIYLPWLPQTFAEWNVRKVALDTLSKRLPSAMKKLLPMLLPKGSDTGWPGHQLRWRQFDMPCRKAVTYAEIFEIHGWLIDKLIEMAPEHPEMIDILVDAINYDLLPKERTKLIDVLRDSRNDLAEQSLVIWHGLRKTLSRHRSYPNARWALNEPVLNRIEEVFGLYQPDSTYEQNIWMFQDHWPQFPEGIERKPNEASKIIHERRVAAFKELHTAYSLDQLVGFCEGLENGWDYGYTASFVIDSETDERQFLQSLFQGNQAQFLAAQGFLVRDYLKKKVDWLKPTCEFLLNSGISGDLLGKALSRLTEKEEIWDLVESLGNEVKSGYWKNAGPHFYELTTEQKIRVFDTLNHFHRYVTVIDFAGHRCKDLPSELIFQMLENYATKKSDEPLKSVGYELVELLKELDDRTDIELQQKAQLEWLYLPMLASYGSNRKPKYLHDEISQSPHSFVEVLKWVYRPDSDEMAEAEAEGKSDEELAHRSYQGLQLLKSWSQIPGVNEAGAIDEGFLNTWIDQVRELSEAVGRSTPADALIGEILGKYSDKEAVWPPKEIADVIDRLNSEVVNNNFRCQVKNNRGMTSRSPFEGGDQERVLVKLFTDRADHYMASHPTTSAILRGFAQEYEDEARWEDERAEQTDSEY